MSRPDLAEAARANLAAARATLAAAVQRLSPPPGPALAAVLAILGERAHG